MAWRPPCSCWPIASRWCPRLLTLLSCRMQERRKAALCLGTTGAPRRVNCKQPLTPIPPAASLSTSIFDSSASLIVDSLPAPLSAHPYDKTTLATTHLFVAGPSDNHTQRKFVVLFTKAKRHPSCSWPGAWVVPPGVMR